MLLRPRNFYRCPVIAFRACSCASTPANIAVAGTRR